MFCVAVFDTVEQNRAKVKEALVGYSMRHDTEIDALWFSKALAGNHIEKYIGKFQIALISLDSNWIPELGSVIYQNNPSCLICYYSAARRDVTPLLHSRPIAFYLWQQNSQELAEILQDMILDWTRQNGVFHFTTRKKLFSVPVQTILYFESDLKYTIIHYLRGEKERVFGKLSEIYRSLESENIASGFVWAHKSYIVNHQHVMGIDKTAKTLLLSDNTTVPISSSRYQSVLAGLSQTSKNAVWNIKTAD